MLSITSGDFDFQVGSFNFFLVLFFSYSSDKVLNGVNSYQQVITWSNLLEHLERYNSCCHKIFVCNYFPCSFAMWLSCLKYATFVTFMVCAVFLDVGVLHICSTVLVPLWFWPQWSLMLLGCWNQLCCNLWLFHTQHWYYEYPWSNPPLSSISHSSAHNHCPLTFFS